MRIGELAAASGVNAKLIRHYESVGLVPKATRSGNGYRAYAKDDVQVLRFVRQSRGLGFSTKEIKRLMILRKNKNRACKDVKALALQHLNELETKIDEMQDMAKSIRALVSQCRDDNLPECSILDALA